MKKADSYMPKESHRPRDDYRDRDGRDYRDRDYRDRERSRDYRDRDHRDRDHRDRDDRGHRDREHRDRDGKSSNSKREEPPVKVDEEVLKKIGEIKTNEKLILNFHKSITKYNLEIEVEIPAKGRKIATFLLPNLEVFSSELTGRRVKVRQHDQLKIIKIIDQIVAITIKDRKPAVEVLLENTSSKTVNVQKLMFNKMVLIQLERIDGEESNTFDVPEDDTYAEEIDRKLFEEDPYTATTTQDIVIPPKSLHTETCELTCKGNEIVLNKNKLLLITKSKHHSMKIGMRKMIFVPKVFSILEDVQPLGSTVNPKRKIDIQIYNASKQGLRISNKTNIGDIMVEKENAFSPVECEVLSSALFENVIKPGSLLIVKCQVKVTESSSCFDGQFGILEKQQTSIVKEGLVKVSIEDGVPYVNIELNNDTDTRIVIPKSHSCANVRLQIPKAMCSQHVL